MFSTALLTISLVYVASSNKIANFVKWKYTLLKRENAAVQAEAITKCWFCSYVAVEGSIDPSEFISGAKPKTDPYLKIPEDLLSELESNNKGLIIEAKIIDQNYSDSFIPEADLLNVPKGSPSKLFLKKNEESQDICLVKRYLIRVTTAYSDADGQPFVLAENIIVLKEPSGAIRAIPLYTKKQ